MEQYLFVIDYQNDFVDGALGFLGREQLDEGIAEKIRSYAPPAMSSSPGHPPGRTIWRPGKGSSLPVKHCVQGSHGWALYGRPPQALADCGAKGIDKPAFGIDCGDPAVLAVLPERADRIELVGLVSNICVGEQCRGAPKPVSRGPDCGGCSPHRQFRPQAPRRSPGRAGGPPGGGVEPGMKRLLYVDCCIRGQTSRTRRLAEAFLDALPQGWAVEPLELAAEGLQYFSGPFFQQRRPAGRWKPRLIRDSATPGNLPRPTPLFWPRPCGT